MMNELDVIILKKENEESESKNIEIASPPVIKNDVKAKLKIKLESRSYTINKKFKQLNKSYKDKIKNIFHSEKNKLSKKDLNKLVTIKDEKVTDAIINTDPCTSTNNNDNPINLKIENEELPNINEIKQNVTPIKDNNNIKKAIQSKIKSKAKRQIKQSPAKKFKNTCDVNEYIINENDDICKMCKQKLDDQLILYSGQPQHGFEEELANIDSRLLVINNDLHNTSKDDIKVYNKLTNFSIYCKNSHLYPIEYDFTERNVELYFSGYVKMIDSDDVSIENGVPGKNFGPILNLRIISFNNEEKPILQINTNIGDYILMKPSEEYAPFMKSFVVKTMISKIVIEYLIQEPNATYEDLLFKFQNTPTLIDLLSTFTEDTLMRYALFICEQVMFFDEKAKPWEQLLVVAPCIRRLFDLTGRTLLEKKKVRQQSYWNCMESNYREILMQNSFKNKTNHLLTQQLITRLLPIKGQLVNPEMKNGCRSRCGLCRLCRWPINEACLSCSKKKKILYLKRCCLYHQIQVANNEDSKYMTNVSLMEVDNSIDVYKNSIKIFSCFLSQLSWIGEPVARESGNVYYNQTRLDDEVISKDDFVFVFSVDASVPAQIVKIAYMWEDESGMARFHANYLWAQRDTVLGELTDSKELFVINRCCNMAMTCAVKKAQVFKRTSPEYLENSGANKVNEDIPKNSFFYQRCYDPVTGCFRDLPSSSEISEMSEKSSHNFCYNCEAVRLRNERNIPRPVEKLKENDVYINYNAVMYRGEEYHIGTCVYLKPKSLYYKYPMLTSNAKYSYATKDINNEKYPEYYRKSGHSETNSKFHFPRPFDIGYIMEILTIKDKLYIKVKKLYRPENTHKGEIFNQCDINLLFWSNEECTISFNNVISKCFVTHGKSLQMNLYEWLNKGPDRFYFTRIYDDKKFYIADKKVYNCKYELLEIPKDYPITNKLKTLDIFAGCGGLSLGLSQSGVANISWAIESDPLAAKTYKLNNPDTLVFIENTQDILKLIMEGKTFFNNQYLPTKEDVELICATLPSKNLRSLNNIFSFKNSDIATFISFCEYYKPYLFVLVADEGLIKNNLAFKWTIACFISMGYQIAFDLLQVGSYGAPQNCRKLILLGAASGQTLPKFPRSLHVFPKLYCPSEIIIDDKKYTRENYWIESAPYRVMTIRDAVCDLPIIKTGYNERVINYYDKPAYYYQKMMRLNMLEPILFDHVCKNLDPVVQARITQIPTAPGSDWRNIPNIEIQLTDGSNTKKLVYDEKSKNTKGSDGVSPDSCNCPIGKICHRLRNGQETSMIPWYLVHSGSKNSHWRGLYSRLSWDGFFMGIISNPELLSKEGPVIHPSQPRVVSVRECARSQGFPDDFIFSEEATIHDKYSQIASAVSPLLAFAIGKEIGYSFDSQK